MIFWDAIDSALQGVPVRLPDWTEGKSLVFDAGSGSMPAVAVLVTAEGVRTVVQNTEIGLAEWNRDDWEVLA